MFFEENDKPNWKKDKYLPIDRINKSLFGEPLGRGLNGRCFNGKFRYNGYSKPLLQFYDKKNFLETYQNLLKLILNGVEQALKKIE